MGSLVWFVATSKIETSDVMSNKVIYDRCSSELCVKIGSLKRRERPMGCHTCVYFFTFL